MADVVACPSCGRKVSVKESHCIHCGEPLDGAEGYEAPPPADIVEDEDDDLVAPPPVIQKGAAPGRGGGGGGGGRRKRGRRGGGGGGGGGRGRGGGGGGRGGGGGGGRGRAPARGRGRGRGRGGSGGMSLVAKIAIGGCLAIVLGCGGIWAVLYGYGQSIVGTEAGKRVVERANSLKMNGSMWGSENEGRLADGYASDAVQALVSKDPREMERVANRLNKWRGRVKNDAIARAAARLATALRDRADELR